MRAFYMLYWALLVLMDHRNRIRPVTGQELQGQWAALIEVRPAAWEQVSASLLGQVVVHLELPSEAQAQAYHQQQNVCL